MQYCAYPPPLTSAHTLSPDFQRVTPGPVAATSPATSSPGISVAPGGPKPRLRCPQSWRLMPANATLISTSPARGSGTGRVTCCKTSGPPARAIVIAFIVLGSMISLVIKNEWHDASLHACLLCHNLCVRCISKNVGHYRLLSDVQQGGDTMTSRRKFIKDTAGAISSVVFTSCGLLG